MFGGWHVACGEWHVVSAKNKTSKLAGSMFRDSQLSVSGPLVITRHLSGVNWHPWVLLKQVFEFKNAFKICMHILFNGPYNLNSLFR